MTDAAPSFAVITDSTSDISPKIAAELGITIVLYRWNPALARGLPRNNTQVAQIAWTSIRPKAATPVTVWMMPGCLPAMVSARMRLVA